jgi:hypothetical protein
VDQVITTYVTDVVTENAESGHDQVFSSITYTLTENVEDLYLLGTDQLDGTGNDLGNYMVGNAGNNRLSGGLGNDLLSGGAGDDSYVFTLGDGQDIVTNDDITGFDRILFGSAVDSTSAVLFRSGDDLEIGYGPSDWVTVSRFFIDEAARVDEVNLADGNYLTDVDINQIIQDMAAYAITEGISLNSVDDVKQQEPLMAMIADSWHQV